MAARAGVGGRGLQRDRPEAVVAELARLPLSEEEVMKLSAHWKDPLMRARKGIEWQVWARDKFRKMEQAGRLSP